ncbi:MAG: uroporphyrinogen-III C-methyltransferase [Pedobacter sp.]|nr:uroporphyrinogen-III C-methyltransferase [Pedobacter sp.]
MTPDKKNTATRVPLVSTPVLAIRSRPWFSYVLALLAVLIAAYVWKIASDDSEALRSEHEKLVQLESRFADAQRQQQRLNDDLTLRGRQLDVLNAQLAKWNDTLNADQRRAWLLNESDHYLRLAQQHLLLTRDVVGARTLLDVADRLLAAHGDNKLLGLRQAIAKDRLALSAALNVDVAGIYLRLGALSEHVATLQLPIVASERLRREEVVAPPTPAPATDSLLDSGWQKIRDLVTVRKHEEPVKPLLPESDRALVREAVRLDLAQAQLALLRGEPAIYKASLTTAKNRLARYFPLLPKTEYNSLQQELNALAAVDIRPALPDLAASIKALDALSASASRVPTALSGNAP